MNEITRRTRFRRTLVLFGTGLLAVTVTVSAAARRGPVTSPDAVPVSTVETPLQESFEWVQPAAATAEAQPAAKPTPLPYILRTQDGCLAIFREGNPVPEVITGILTDTLPAEDREQLSRGILVETEEELLRLLEDFGS